MPARPRLRKRRAPIAATIAELEPDPEDDDNHLEAGAAPEADRAKWDARLRRQEATAMRRGDGMNVVMALHYTPAVEVEPRFTGGRRRRRWTFAGTTYIDVTDLVTA